MGAYIPFHAITWKSGRPCADTGGTPGNKADSFNDVTASARSLPPVMNERAALTVSMPICTCPPIRSVVAVAEPL
ncbi:hypothetical protein D3C72_2336660 [compost metagenome]